jgi:hypothetical protein
MADDPHAAFAQAAVRDGVELEPATFDFLSEQGHAGLERIAKARRDAAIVEPVKRALAALAAIYVRLKGDATVLHAARENLLLPVDLVGGTVVAIDGPEHFTSFRLMTLGLYPADAPLGFDREAYERLCRELAPQSDRLHRGLAAKGFGFGGVQRERAYHDALTDLAVPAMGHPPVLRIAAPDGDGAAAYDRHHEALRSLAIGER